MNRHYASKYARFTTNTPLKPCSVCHYSKETRPYGKHGAEICFSCAMKTPEGKKRAEKVFLESFMLKKAGDV